MSASGLERHVLKLPALSAAHRRVPWNMGNKQRGLRQLRFRPSGIVACPGPTSMGLWATQAQEAELREGRDAAVRSGTAYPVGSHGDVIGA